MPVLPLDSSRRRDPALVWTGEEVLVWDGSNRTRRREGHHRGRGAAYNPQTNRWRPLPRAPLTNRTWSIQGLDRQPAPGRRGMCGDSGEISARTAPLDGRQTLDTDRRWPWGDRAETASAWTGSELIIWSATTSRDGLRIRNAPGPTTRAAVGGHAPPAPHPRDWRVRRAGDRLVSGVGSPSTAASSNTLTTARLTPHGNRWRPCQGPSRPRDAADRRTGDRAIFIGGMNLGDDARTDRGNIVAIHRAGARLRPAGLRSGRVGGGARRPAAEPAIVGCRSCAASGPPPGPRLLRAGRLA